MIQAKITTEYTIYCDVCRKHIEHPLRGRALVVAGSHVHLVENIAGGSQHKSALFGKIAVCVDPSTTSGPCIRVASWVLDALGVKYEIQPLPERTVV